MSVAEKFGSERWRTGHSGTSRELTYLAVGYATGELAGAAVESLVPRVYGLHGLPLASIDPEEVADGIYEVRCLWSWEPREPRPEGQQAPGEEPEQLFSFNTAGGTTKKYQSRHPTIRYGARINGDLTTAPDFGGAIGVTRDSIEGVDVVVPQLEFQLKRTFQPGWLTFSRLKLLHDLTGTVNQLTFGEFAPGEVLFLGADGQQKSRTQPVTATFHFRSSSNSGEQQFGSGSNTVTIAGKKGWEYLWFLYEDAVDDAANYLVRRLRAAYIEKVYEERDWSGLGVLA